MDELKKILKEIYKGEAEKIFLAVQDIIEQVPPIADKSRSKDWYKYLNLYVTYADSFVNEKGEQNFNSLKEKIPYIKDLGCNAIHVLPYYESPMIDRGFDVSEFYQVRVDLGGNKSFDEFLKAAKEAGLSVFADLVVNHVSDQHIWYKRAQAGQDYYREFFISTPTQPKMLNKYERDGRIWAMYELNGKQFESLVHFPDQMGDIPNWIVGSDGYWYYHSFYPQQIDLNWFNPDLFVEFTKILTFWAKQGLSFRLDAVGNIGKQLEADQVMDSEYTHKLVAALHTILKMINPQAVFLPEAGGVYDKLIEYAGTEKRIESELTYNFPLASRLWYAISKGSAEGIWRDLALYPMIPKWLQPLNFLRNHDNLHVTALPQSERIELALWLLGERGMTKVLSEIAGRTASFLREDPELIIMAHFLLASMPGAVAVMYGDESGEVNDTREAIKHWHMKMERSHQNVNIEFRDIARGVIEPGEIQAKNAEVIYKALSKIFTTRQKLPLLYTDMPKRMTNVEDGVFAAEYQYKNEYLYTLVNLENKSKKIEISPNQQKVDVILNLKCRNNKDSISMSPFSGIWLRTNKKIDLKEIN